MFELLLFICSKVTWSQKKKKVGGGHNMSNVPAIQKMESDNAEEDFTRLCVNPPPPLSIMKKERAPVKKSKFFPVLVCHGKTEHDQRKRCHHGHFVPQNKKLAWHMCVLSKKSIHELGGVMKFSILFVFMHPKKTTLEEGFCCTQ